MLCVDVMATRAATRFRSMFDEKFEENLMDWHLQNHPKHSGLAGLQNPSGLEFRAVQGLLGSSLHPNQKRP